MSQDQSQEITTRMNAVARDTMLERKRRRKVKIVVAMIAIAGVLLVGYWFLKPPTSRTYLAPFVVLDGVFPPARFGGTGQPADGFTKGYLGEEDPQKPYDGVAMQTTSVFYRQRAFSRERLCSHTMQRLITREELIALDQEQYASPEPARIHWGLSLGRDESGAYYTFELHQPIEVPIEEARLLGTIPEGQTTITTYDPDETLASVQRHFGYFESPYVHIYGTWATRVVPYFETTAGGIQLDESNSSPELSGGECAVRHAGLLPGY